MQCDMCGKEGELFKVLVEGTQMDVCINCSRFGKILKKPEPPKPKFKKQQVPRTESAPKTKWVRPEPPQLAIVDDYTKLIKDAREKRGLKQSELAIRVAERESVIHKIETGSYEPSIKLATKLGKFLNVKLIEEIETEEVQEIKKSESDELTLGDLIKIKKR